MTKKHIDMMDRLEEVFCYNMEQRNVIICINFVVLNLMKMKTDEKNAVELHLLKACGFHSATPQYKFIQRLFKDDELLFTDVNYDDVVSLRKELWFLKFECGMRFDRIIITDDVVMKYYLDVMGLQSISSR